MNSGFTQPDWKSCVTLNSRRDWINYEVKKTERAQTSRIISSHAIAPLPMTRSHRGMTAITSMVLGISFNVCESQLHICEVGVMETHMDVL